MLGMLRLMLISVGALTLACSVDHRKLHLGPSAAGNSGAGGSLASGGTLSDAGNVGGEGGLMGNLSDGCLADLNTDHIPDCRQTLLDNGSFASDVENWTPDTDTVLTWDEQNALEDAPSGSAKLESATDSAVASQCAAVEEMQLIIAYGQAQVLAVAGDADGSSAELKVSFFPSRDCSGESIAYFETPTSDKVGQWVVVQAGMVAPVGTKSAALDLVGIKAVDADQVTAYFDNVMLQTQAVP